MGAHFLLLIFLEGDDDDDDAILLLCLIRESSKLELIYLSLSHSHSPLSLFILSSF